LPNVSLSTNVTALSVPINPIYSLATCAHSTGTYKLSQDAHSFNLKVQLDGGGRLHAESCDTAKGRGDCAWYVAACFTQRSLYHDAKAAPTQEGGRGGC
jgi:hypothetical protein